MASGVRPWELPRFTFAEVLKMYWGIQQNNEGLRRAAYIIHSSMVEKPADIEGIWPLPFDESDKERAERKSAENIAMTKRLKARTNNAELKKLLDQSLKNG